MRRVAGQLTSACELMMGPTASSRAGALAIVAAPVPATIALSRQPHWLPAPTEPSIPGGSRAIPPQLQPPSLAARMPDWSADSAPRASARPSYCGPNPFAPPSSRQKRQPGGREPRLERGFSSASQAAQDAEEVQKLLRLLQDIPHHRQAPNPPPSATEQAFDRCHAEQYLEHATAFAPGTTSITSDDGHGIF